MKACVNCGDDFASLNPRTLTCSPDCSRARNRQMAREARAANRAAARLSLTDPKLTPLPDDRTPIDGEPWPVMAATGGHDRQIACKRYDECLNVAVRLQWAGFACRDCGIRGTCDEVPEVALGGGASLYTLEHAPDMTGVSLSLDEMKRTSIGGPSRWRGARRVAVAEAEANRRARLRRMGEP